MNIFLCIAKIKLKTKRTLALLALPALLLGGDIAMAIEEPDFEIIEPRMILNIAAINLL